MGQYPSAPSIPSWRSYYTGATPSIPSWRSNAPNSYCTRCTKPFHLCKRPHQCRQCGSLVCSACSNARLTNLRDATDNSYYRVCSVCKDEFVKNGLVTVVSTENLNSYLWACERVKSILIFRHEPVQRRQTEPVKQHVEPVKQCVEPVKERDNKAVGLDDAPLEDCPACQRSLKYVNPSIAAKHIIECLNMPSRKVVGNFYTLETAGDGLVGKECAICLDEFEKDQKVALVNCCCKFHYECIEPWFSKGKPCPSHF